MATGTSEIVELLDQIIARYKPGGEFGKPEEALLGRAKTKSLARTAQSLVSRGLAGTTAGAGAGRLWEEEVGMPARLRLEDIRTQRLSEAMGAKAGYLERAQQRQQDIIADAPPSMASQGLNVFGEPLGTFGLSQAGAGGAGGAGGGYGGDYGGVGTSYAGGGVSGGIYRGPEAGGGATFGGAYDPTVGQAILGGPQAGQFVTAGGDISGGAMGGFEGEGAAAIAGAGGAGAGGTVTVYRAQGGGYTTNKAMAKPNSFATVRDARTKQIIRTFRI